MKNFLIGLGLIIVFSLIGCSNSESISKVQEDLKSNDIEQIKMSMWVLKGNFNDNVNVELSKEEINHLLKLYNETPEDRITEVEQVPPDLKAGVMIEMKTGTIIRIQYDGEDIYNTITNETGQRMYVIDYPELNSFFDNKLEEKY
ncbi:hypothetical protein [Aquibacillus albus]|uniref:Lipoprotein n=1 Tax=Aquibacillus albus TaxID=1168171 RepID=A0ABS2MVL1_9BACI|nr:hypothetical protein [Aquibacillus albus]MBM7569927.1 hypothetical protein [Aquibacillus albus]